MVEPQPAVLQMLASTPGRDGAATEVDEHRLALAKFDLESWRTAYKLYKAVRLGTEEELHLPGVPFN